MQLLDLAEIHSGHPFRRRIADLPGSGLHVVQMRDITPRLTIDWSTVCETRPTSSRTPRWLKPGQLLVAACGNHYYAAVVSGIPKPAVASPHFFVVQIRDRERVLPEYLAFVLNHGRAQSYLHSHASGNASRNIRRDVLAMTPVTIPSIEHQRDTLALADSLIIQRNHIERLTYSYAHVIDQLADDAYANPLPGLRKTHDQTIKIITEARCLWDAPITKTPQYIREPGASYSVYRHSGATAWQRIGANPLRS